MMMFPTLNEQMDILKSGAAEVLPEDEIVKKIEYSLKHKKPMIIKLGCDPSRPDLHIGHAVVLRKMRQFQDMGHHAILIVGDFTGMIGDPTGKSKTRPALTLDETRANGQSYFDQASRILSEKNLTIKYNSEWLSEMSFADVIKLSAQYTVAQMLERDDFSKRFNANEPLSIHEFLYPLAQAMDSVAIKSDIELGGTDQKFNLIVGREIQKAYGVMPQGIIIMPILEGTDGVEKMSKSLGNYIAITDTPREMFGKVMSIPDTMITRYYQYAAMASQEEIATMSTGLQDGSLHPRSAKVETAMRTVALYHGADAGKAAFEEFERIFVKKDVPDVIDDHIVNDLGDNPLIVDVMAHTGMVTSKGEARRLIQGGGVSIDGEKVQDISQTIDLSSPKIIKAGKRKFLRVMKG
ncbi:MAG: tyrosine--tRNA ligase [Ignavibacteria bacterium]|nr:tyrosine--tRNA ligase [Ignavibacteria bacterium]